MRTFLILAVWLSAMCVSLAGDGVGGTNRYDVDFTRKHTQYNMTKDDTRWAISLVRNLKATGEVVYFTRTDLPLQKDGALVRSLIYRRVDQPQYYYVAEGDVMLDLKKRLIYNPGVGGFSMHSPKSRNFILCLHFQKGGVPFVRHSDVGRSPVWWFARDNWKRLEDWQ